MSAALLIGNEDSETTDKLAQGLDMQIKVLNTKTLDNLGGRLQQLQQILAERNTSVLVPGTCEPSFLTTLFRLVNVPQDPEPEVINTSFGPDVGYSFSEIVEGSRVQGFFKLNITLYATKKPESKWIKFRLTDDVGIKSSMSHDSICRRGLFNNKAEICIYPVIDGRNSSKLPDGWSRPHVQPQTLNSPTEYTTTTGWTFGAGGGGNQDGGNVALNATFSETTQEKRTIRDFSIRNISDGAMTGWEFYFTNMKANKMRTKLGAVKPIPDLASGTLHLNGEAIYQVPATFDDTQQFQVYFKASFASVPFGVGRHHEIHEFPAAENRFHNFEIDMSTVRCN